jgi:hypothetical protein
VVYDWLLLGVIVNDVLFGFGVLVFQLVWTWLQLRPGDRHRLSIGSLRWVAPRAPRQASDLAMRVTLLNARPTA